ncbi:MAG: LPS-assembly protein LptD [Epsilonproteobacteria bacterium]|nr:MAG: LPS-assembly protein LptD [Campylobacterota bacterium]
MFKHFFIPLLFILTSIEILKANTDKIEITAKHIEVTKNQINAKDNVLVYYNDSVIKASSAHYNKENKLLILDGNIELIGYQGSKEHTQHMEIYTDTKEVTFDELFLVSQNDVWIFSDDVHKKDSNYTFGESLISSCDVENPLWKMTFSDSIYDSQEQYMKMYNAKMYVWDVPVFYTPYLAFSTNKQRSSGLLFPAFGYSADEGFLYEQPIFWAIAPNMDIEFNPQIRTARSVGLYTTFRFADSAYSSGALRVGYFKDKASYAQENDLPNDSHYGVEFNYESSKVFSDSFKEGFTDGLYINTTFLNDIDYLNLQQSSLEHFGLTPLQESRVNYFAHNNDYYAGLNAKYFIDTRKESNDDTLQILPSIQLHKYLDYLFWENLTYSVDFHINHLDRKEGATLSQAEFRVPLEFTSSFFDDFLSISLGEELYYSKFFFANGTYTYNDFEYYSNIHKVRLFSDLSKKYENMVHVMQPSIQYVKPGNDSQSPIDFSLLSDEQKALFAVGLPEEQLDLSLSHYFYDNAMKLKFYQRLVQKYYVNRDYSLGDLSNEMQYNWHRWSMYSNLIYSHEFSKVRESSTRISLFESTYHFSLGHTYKEILPDLPNSTDANDVNLVLGYTVNERIKLNAAFTYDIDDASSKQWGLGANYTRDCWSVAASIRQDITPRPTGFTTDNTFYVQFNFTPFGGVGTGETP